MDVYYVKTINSEITINCLKHCFSNFGIPEIIVSDNATCFRSREFELFVKNHGIEHKTGAPYNPATNGLAERAVKVFKTHYKKFDDKLSVQNKLDKFLYTYRKKYLLKWNLIYTIGIDLT